MQGRLAAIKFFPEDDGTLTLTARVKTHAGKMVFTGLRPARNDAEVLEVIREANEAYPNPARRRMEERT